MKMNENERQEYQSLSLTKNILKYNLRQNLVLRPLLSLETPTVETGLN